MIEEKYVHYTKLHIKQNYGIDDETIESMVANYGLLNWIKEDPQVMHYDAKAMAKEIVESCRKMSN